MLKPEQIITIESIRQKLRDRLALDFAEMPVAELDTPGLVERIRRLVRVDDGQKGLTL